MFILKFFKNCCINTTCKFSSFLPVITALLLTSCGLLGSKDKKDENKEVTTQQKEWEANVFKRVEENKGQGVILFGGGKRESATEGDNVIWQASLNVLADIPLAQANYTGGVIITDWYNSELSKDSVKISIFIKSARLETNSFDVKSFKKSCLTENNCQTSSLSSDFNQKIKDKVLQQARIISVDKENSKNKK